MKHAVLGCSFVLLSSLAPALAHPPPGIPSTAQSAPVPPATLGGYRLDEIQGQLVAERLDGWLLYDDANLDPSASDVLHPSTPPRRRWFYLVPAVGEPTLLAWVGDAAAFELAPGRHLTWKTWRELDASLKSMLKGRKKVAMAYTTRAALPSLSRVDAGTVEQVRSAGVNVVSSGDLRAYLEGHWSETQRATHLLAAQRLLALKDQAFKMIADRVAQGAHVNELEVQQYLASSLSAMGVETQAPIVVAAGANAVDTTYTPSPRRSSPIKPGDVVLVRIAARQMGVPDAVYADVTWLGYVGGELPATVAARWAAIRDARDKAIAFVGERRAKALPVAAYEVDEVVRLALEKSGFADKVIAPTGHCLGQHARGDGPVLDDTIAHDERLLQARTGIVVAPTLAFPGEMALSAGANLYLGDKAAEPTYAAQKDVELIGRRAP